MTDITPQTPQEKTLRRVVCIGKEISPDGYPSFLVDEIDADGKRLEQTAAYTANGKLARYIKQFRAGVIYEVMADEKSIVPATIRWVDEWDNDDDRLKWTTQSRAIDAELERRKFEDKAGDLAAILKPLDPIREMYVHALPMRKIAIEMQVIAYLRFGQRALQKEKTR